MLATQRCVLMEAGLLLPKAVVEAAEVQTAVEEIGGGGGPRKMGKGKGKGKSYTARRAGRKLVSVVLTLAEGGRLERTNWSVELRERPEYFGDAPDQFGGWLPEPGQGLFVYRPPPSSPCCAN